MLERKAESVISQDPYTLRQKFNQLFPHGWDFIVKETPLSAWKTVKKYKLTEQKLWYKYTDPEKVLGVRFGVETKHGLYDIDLGSIHDPREQEQSLSLLKEELEKWGIVRLFFIQSSSNGGLHLYFHLERPVNTFRLACVMNKAAFDAGLEVKKGQLETFPNTKRYNSLFNGHRLPLQQGSLLLDSDYVPESDRLEDFIAAADWSAAGNDTDLLESRLDEAYDWLKAQKNQKRVYSPTDEDRGFIEQINYAQREIKEGFLNTIRIAVEQGFCGTGETNELLLTIAKLGRILHGLSGQRYIDYIRETITSCPGYAQYCRHKHEINRRCREVARYGEKQWYPYRSRLPKNRSSYKHIKDSLTNKANLNHERQHNAKSRIIQAVDIIVQQQGKLPSKVGECKLAIRNVTKKLFGISVSDATLNKRSNLPLWHPKHRVSQTSPNQQPTPKTETTTTNKHQKNTITSTQPAINSTKKTRPNENKSAPSSNSITQPTLQSKPRPDSQPRVCATPCHVTRQTHSQPKTAKHVHRQHQKKSCHTLTHMKGVFVVSGNSLMRFSGILPASVLSSLPVFTGGLGKLILAFLLLILSSALQQTYYRLATAQPDLVFTFSGYQGKSASGLVSRKGKKSNQLESITPESLVTIQTNQLHSSHYRESPRQILVYVKPLINADDWTNGIAVPLELLHPAGSQNDPSSA